MGNETLLLDYCTQASQEGRNLFFMLLLGCILIVGTIGNFSAIIVIILSRNLRVQQTNQFIVSLALTDLGALLFVTSLRIDIHRHNQNFCFNLSICKMFNITDIIFHIGSVTHLFVISVERFIAIKKPFFHRAYMTSSVTFACVIGIWLYCIAWSVAGLFRWNDKKGSTEHIMYIFQAGKRSCIFNNKRFFTTVYFAIYLIPLFIMGYVYTYILRVAHRQSRTIASLEREQIAAADSDNGISMRKKKREIKATKTLAIVYGAFLVCWFPLTIIVLLMNWNKHCLENVPAVVRQLLISLFRDTLPPLNSCLNPFIYIIFNKQFRKAFIKLILRQHVANMLASNYSTSRHVAKNENAMSSHFTGGESRTVHYNDAFISENHIETSTTMNDLSTLSKYQ